MSEVLDALIVGAGFAGVAAAIELKEAGLNNFIIAEKTDGISGTWYDNHYPGAACDVPSALYSYSFAPNPDWSRRFSPWHEIMGYVENVVDGYGLREKIRHNTEIISGRFDEKRGVWRIRTKNGDTFTARFLIVSVAILGTPKMPDIEGMDSFSGPAFHSARWDRNVDLKGKRLSVIGSAASAVQIVPEVAKICTEVNVFQRTPNWIIPRMDRAYKRFEKAMFRVFPITQKLVRAALYLYLDRWFFNVFAREGRVNAHFRRMAERFRRKKVKDPDLRAKLTPDYPIGCKRVLLSDDYYEALQRENVNLVTTPIRRIVPQGIELEDGRVVESDILVYATGFKATEFMPGLELEGLGGARLSEWRRRPRAYKGITVGDMPNAFFLLGPNTGLGHASMILMIEAQTPYMRRLIKATPNPGWFVPREEPVRRYNDEIQNTLSGRIWATSCQSWYKTKDGDIPTLWPYTCHKYKQMMEVDDRQAYRFVTPS